MAAKADTVLRLPAAHMVQLSRPEDLAEILERAALHLADTRPA
jgi:hypothetical protein